MPAADLSTVPPSLERDRGTGGAPSSWQAGDPGDLASSRRWRIVQLLPADGWWWVDCTKTGAVPELEATRLLALAVIEVREQDGQVWQTTTGLDRYRMPVELGRDAYLGNYLHGDDLPERATRCSSAPDLQWQGG